MSLSVAPAKDAAVRRPPINLPPIHITSLLATPPSSATSSATPPNVPPKCLFPLGLPTPDSDQSDSDITPAISPILACPFPTPSYPPTIFNSLSLSDSSKIRFDPSSALLTAATPQMLVLYLTSHNVLDYDLLSDFFLTYRLFLDPASLLELVFARLAWAISTHAQAPLLELGRDVAVRTFVLIRHWVLNFFPDDFVPSYPLRLRFAQCANALYSWPPVQATPAFLLILAQLKKSWLRSCALYWDMDPPSSSAPPNFSYPRPQTLPVSPGGKVGSISMAPTKSSPTKSASSRRTTMLSLYQVPIKPILTNTDPLLKSAGFGIMDGSLIKGGISLSTDATVTSFSPPTPVPSLLIPPSLLPPQQSPPPQHLPTHKPHKSIRTIMENWKRELGHHKNKAISKFFSKVVHISKEDSLVSQDDPDQSTLDEQPQPLKETHLPPPQIPNPSPIPPHTPRIDVLSARVIQELEAIVKARESPDDDDSDDATSIDSHKSGEQLPVSSNSDSRVSLIDSLNMRAYFSPKRTRTVPSVNRQNSVASSISSGVFVSAKTSPQKLKASPSFASTFSPVPECKTPSPSPSFCLAPSLSTYRIPVFSPPPQPSTPNLSPKTSAPSRFSIRSYDSYDSRASSSPKSPTKPALPPANGLTGGLRRVGHLNLSPPAFYLAPGESNSMLAQTIARDLGADLDDTTIDPTLLPHHNPILPGGLSPDIVAELAQIPDDYDDDNTATPNAVAYALSKLEGTCPPHKTTPFEQNLSMQLAHLPIVAPLHIRSQTPISSPITRPLSATTPVRPSRNTSNLDASSPLRPRPHSSPQSLANLSRTAAPEITTTNATLSTIAPSNPPGSTDTSFLLKSSQFCDTYTPPQEVSSSSPTQMRVPGRALSYVTSAASSPITDDFLLFNFSSGSSLYQDAFETPKPADPNAFSRSSSLLDDDYYPGNTDSMAHRRAPTRFLRSSKSVSQLLSRRSSAASSYGNGGGGSNSEENLLFGHASRNNSLALAMGFPTMFEEDEDPQASVSSTTTKPIRRLFASQSSAPRPGITRSTTGNLLRRGPSLRRDPVHAPKAHSLFDLHAHKDHPLDNDNDDMSHKDTAFDRVSEQSLGPPKQASTPPLGSSSETSFGSTTPPAHHSSAISLLPSPVMSTETTPPDMPSPEEDDEADPLSIAATVPSGSHAPFILHYGSRVLTEQLTLVERDALAEVDWKELVEMQWPRTVIPVQSWLGYLVESQPPPDAPDEGPHGAAVVIARFNLMVNWVKSEILLTRSLADRSCAVARFIHVAHHARQLQNYATVVQIVLALTSSTIRSLARTWAAVPAADRAMLAALEHLVSPLRNFKNLRSELSNLDAARGCIPFLGIYLSDLTANAERPKYVGGQEGGLVNMARFRTSASVVKSLMQCIEWAGNYDLVPDYDLLAKCLYIQSLTEDEMNECFQYLDESRGS